GAGLSLHLARSRRRASSRRRRDDHVSRIAVEHGPKARIFARPAHPYTQALLDATPGLGRTRQRIVPKGELPSPLDPPKGCVFSTRCPHVTDLCRAQRPPLRPLDGRLVACHYAERFLEIPAA